MKESEVRERVYRLVTDFRENGMSYLEIELFWLKCIRTASKEISLLKHLRLELKIIKYQVLLEIEVWGAWYKDSKLLKQL